MSQKITSQFGYFEVANPGSPGVYVRVGGVSGISDIRSGTAAEIDVTDLSSTGKEFLLGLADSGTMSLTCFYDPIDPGQVILEQLRESSALNGFRVGVRNPAGSGSPTGYILLEFDGLVQTFPITLAVDAVVSGTISIRISGPITKIS